MPGHIRFLGRGVEVRQDETSGARGLRHAAGPVRGDVVGRPPSSREGALAHEGVRSAGQAGEALALDGVPGVDHRSAGRLHAERQAPRRVPGQRSLHHPAAPTGDVPTLLPEFGDLEGEPFRHRPVERRRHLTHELGETATAEQLEGRRPRPPGGGVAGLEERHQIQHVVGMKVGDEHAAQFLVAHAGHGQTGEGARPRVEEERLSGHPQQIAGRAPARRGHGGAGAKDRQMHVGSSLVAGHAERPRSSKVAQPCTRQAAIGNPSSTLAPRTRAPGAAAGTSATRRCPPA